MKRVLTLCAVTVVAVVLAACDNVAPPGPPSNTINVTATLNPAAPVANGANILISPGQSQVFRVTVPGGVRVRDLLYIELDHDIQLEVRSENYTSVTFSARNQFSFGRNLFGLESLTGVELADLGSQGISVLIPCRGSCVIQRTNTVEDVFFVRARNNSNSTVSVSLYVYGDIHGDTEEPGNDSTLTAPSLPTTGLEEGAIETIGDVDFWHVPAPGTVEFNTTANGPALEAYIVNASGVVQNPGGGPYFAGQTLQVFAGEFVRVWTVDPRLAASSARSWYSLGYVSSALE